MASMENCIYQGEIFLNGLSGAKKDDYIFYVCLIGKKVPNIRNHKKDLNTKLQKS